MDRLRALAMHMLPDTEHTRIRKAVHRLEDGGPDPYAPWPDHLAMGYAVGYWLHERYFKVRARGHEHLPAHGAAVLVGNHSGVLPFDGLMVSVDIFRHTDPARLLHYMVDYYAYDLPLVGTMFRRLGQLPGTRGNFDGLVNQGHYVGVFPEGAAALGKTHDQRYELFPFTEGHVELAARHGVPVVPFGLVGAEEQQTMLRNLAPIAALLRMPYFPITTTFPWLGPLGLLPRPSPYFIEYGAPLTIDPGVLQSAACRSAEVARVRGSVQSLVHRGLQWRRGEVAS